MQPLSIGIAGAGPAGLATALLLSRDGHEVTLFDQFDRPRPLGSGLILQPTGLAVLAELGLAERILALGSRIDRLFGRVLPSRQVVLDVHYGRLGGARFGLAVHRAALFNVLYDAVKDAAIPIETERRVDRIERAGDRRPRLAGGAGWRSGPFDLVIDALGMRSPLWRDFGGGTRRELPYGALWASLPWPSAGFDARALEQRYHRASTMIGVLPIGRQVEGAAVETTFFWSLRLDRYAAWRQRGLGYWKDSVLVHWPETEPLLDQIVDAEQLTLARYGHQMLATPFGERLVAVGDSFHATSPQLGQGANMALLDAHALASALRVEADLGEALRTYATGRRAQMTFYQALSWGFTPFYQSDSRILPPLRDWIVAPGTRLPVARWFVAACVAGLVLAPRGMRGEARS